jgi:plastocyanin
MKKLYLTIMLLAGSLFGNIYPSMATIHVVQVTDYFFTPSNFVATTGDTIHWMWIEGGHTTTSTTIPAGADTWDSPLVSSLPTFDYVVTVAGDYDYICTPHISMGMSGSFTVVNPTGLEELSSPSLALHKSYLANGELMLEFTAPQEQVTIQLFDITGQRVYVEKIPLANTGLIKHSIPVATLPSGIYIINLMTSNDQRTSRIVIE